MCILWGIKKDFISNSVEKYAKILNRWFPGGGTFPNSLEKGERWGGTKEERTDFLPGFLEKGAFETALNNNTWLWPVKMGCRASKGMSSLSKDVEVAKHGTLEKQIMTKTHITPYKKKGCLLVLKRYIWITLYSPIMEDFKFQMVCQCLIPYEMEFWETGEEGVIR